MHEESHAQQPQREHRSRNKLLQVNEQPWDHDVYVLQWSCMATHVPKQDNVVLRVPNSCCLQGYCLHGTDRPSLHVRRKHGRCVKRCQPLLSARHLLLAKTRVVKVGQKNYVGCQWLSAAVYSTYSN